LSLLFWNIWSWSRNWSII